ncbi:type II toxin-antitoxin system ParD family antitoxin [Flavobacterium lacustre]|uniref:type II toxin-antitoxin system ParD family antitoxin n=1 Tax=Flavobacterium lacustre TaxID=3016339 RepID=UPI0022B70400|nr:type II toxin-antitoxin system ParD family antitoxin [Flavobacterium lacustre]
MGKNISISLGNHFETFIEKSVSKGRFQNASEVIRAGLRMLEEEENKVIALRIAIQEGIDSGIAKDFDSQKNLQMLQSKKNTNS